MQYHEQCGPPNFFESFVGLRRQEKGIHATIVSDPQESKNGAHGAVFLPVAQPSGAVGGRLLRMTLYAD